MSDPDVHPSDSTVRLEAETETLDRLEAQWGHQLVRGHQIALAGGGHIRPDGWWPGNGAAGPVVVEVNTRTAPHKGGSRKKVAADVLKLSLARDLHPDARLVLAFVVEHVAAPFRPDSATGWVAAAVAHLDIEIVVVDLGGRWQSRLDEGTDANRRGIAMPDPDG